MKCLIDELQLMSISDLIKQDSNSMDIRFGVKFFEFNTNVPFFSLYLDRSAEIGLINGTGVILDRKFYIWLDKKFFKKFK